MLAFFRDESDGFTFITFVIVPVVDASHWKLLHLAIGPRSFELSL